MRNLVRLLILVFFLSGYSAKAQDNPSLNDFGRIVLNTYLPKVMSIPAEAKELLHTKLKQIVSNNGLAGSTVNPRFIVTASINVGTKDIIAGPPQMIAQNIQITFFIGDAMENKIFSSATVLLRGIGNNENKAFIDAFKRINSSNQALVSLIAEGKTKIIAYFDSQCDFTLKEAMTLKNQGKYDEAIYKLSLVPEVCQDCYFKCLDTLLFVYQEKIDKDCQVKFQEAKTIWAANSSRQGAEDAAEVISQIDPLASCQPEVEKFIKSVDTKLKADEKARWEFKMKQYEDQVAKEKEQMRIAEEKSIRDDEFRENQAVRNLELDKIRVNAYREIAVEYAKNQPKKMTYNNIYWR